MFGFLKRNKAAAKQPEKEMKAPVAPATESAPPAAVNAIKLYTIALDQSCKMARALLEQRGLKYEEIDVTGNGSLISWLSRETGEVTFPRVFVYGKHIGGYEQLRSLEYSGALDRLLRGEGIDEFLKEQEQAARADEWTESYVREQLRGGKTLEICRHDGIELLLWAEVFANPPAVYYEGKKLPITEFDRILGEIMALLDSGQATAQWQEDD